jgi:hypothetical protein
MPAPGSAFRAARRRRRDARGASLASREATMPRPLVVALLLAAAPLAPPGALFLARTHGRRPCVQPALFTVARNHFFQAARTAATSCSPARATAAAVLPCPPSFPAAPRRGRLQGQPAGLAGKGACRGRNWRHRAGRQQPGTGAGQPGVADARGDAAGTVILRISNISTIANNHAGSAVCPAQPDATASRRACSKQRQAAARIGASATRAAHNEKEEHSCHF